ncbi:Pollen_Ole_e_I domain-containing protein [Cephalotus follicularis]|uniref:Pollen_Ole_e_I domain-containing protein n=1 Tax=Cephalotus follicularis TaxID=3775 RepID=A0A1Q3CJY8_CEPFO|nr:Pollen_Ole_e_I domain-containing protein [Cephalotus follicularis]
MDWLHKLLFTAFLIFAAAIPETEAYAMVTGTVICDQCKDGQRSLFDYPISGIKVTMTCTNSDGQITMSGEQTSNWFGSYSMTFDGTPDLSNCRAQVTGSGQHGSAGCAAAAGPAQKLILTFRMFDIEMYAVDSLLTQPAQPMSFCPKPANPAPRPVRPVPPAPKAPHRTPPPFKLPPMPPLSPLPLMPPLPPMPPLPSLPPIPPMPFLEASACPHQNWTMPEYKCYWKVVNRDAKVAVVFGPLAARRYGTDMTLWEGMQGRGDPYRTLLREGTTALLNSYNSLQFRYNAISVITHMNMALMGSTRSVLLTALRFMRANAGSDKVTCKFTPCK